MRILVVDDLTDQIESVHEAVQSVVPDAHVTGVTNAQAAMAAIAAERVDILLTDHKMPGIQGATLLAEVRKSHPGLRRVLMSAYIDETEAHQLVEMGVADAVLFKPFELDELREALAA